MTHFRFLSLLLRCSSSALLDLQVCDPAGRLGQNVKDRQPGRKSLGAWRTATFDGDTSRLFTRWSTVSCSSDQSVFYLWEDTESSISARLEPAYAAYSVTLRQRVNCKPQQHLKTMLGFVTFSSGYVLGQLAHHHLTIVPTSLRARSWPWSWSRWCAPVAHNNNLLAVAHW